MYMAQQRLVVLCPSGLRQIFGVWEGGDLQEATFSHIPGVYIPTTATDSYILYTEVQPPPVEAGVHPPIEG